MLGETFVGFRCKCGEEQDRAATSAECRDIRARRIRDDRRAELMNKAWEPVKAVLESFGSPTDQETKLKLYDELERLMKKFPEYVRYVRVDDAYHCGSDLFFVSHKYEDKRVGKGYWGTSVIYIAQCPPDPPVQFFLYPTHMRALSGVVTKLQADARRLNVGKGFGEL